MTSRERWLACLRGERPDRVPLDYRATEEVTRRLLADLRLPNFAAFVEKFQLDTPVSVGPRYVGPPLAEHESVWGYRSSAQAYPGGEYLEVSAHPLQGLTTLEQVKAHRWPALAWWDFSGVAAACDAAPTRLISGGHMEARLTYAYLRGLEESLCDFMEQPEIAHYILERIFSYHREFLTRLLEAAPGRIQLTGVHDDFGAQTGMLISPGLFRTFFKERMRAQATLARQAGLYVMHHDDGAIRPILPDLIEIGIDMLDPIQWRCNGMEREGLARDFGRKLVFHGGVDNQQTLPFGTPEDVRREVFENLEIFSRCKGYILGPCHNIQPITPTANILALYEAAHAYGA